MNFSKFCETVAQNRYFTSWVQSLGTDLHKHFVSRVMLMAVFSPRQSFSADFGKLQFRLPLLEAATTASWLQSAARALRGQIWSASGILLDKEPADKLAALRLAAERGSDPEPAQHRGLRAWTSSAGPGWSERFPRSEGGHGALGQPGLQPVEEEPLCLAPALFCSVLPAEYPASGELA